MTIKVYNGLKYDGKETPDHVLAGPWSLCRVCVWGEKTEDPARDEASGPHASC